MQGILKISDGTALAIHALFYTATHSGRTVSTSEIAAKYNFSENHLSKVMQRLVKSGYLYSVRGPKGGFTMKKNAETITLMEIYNLFEGEPVLNDCLLETPCGVNDCIFGGLLGELNKLAVSYMTKTNILQTAGKQRLKKS